MLSMWSILLSRLLICYSFCNSEAQLNHFSYIDSCIYLIYIFMYVFSIHYFSKLIEHAMTLVHIYNMFDPVCPSITHPQITVAFFSGFFSVLYILNVLFFLHLCFFLLVATCLSQHFKINIYAPNSNKNSCEFFWPI